MPNSIPKLGTIAIPLNINSSWLALYQPVITAKRNSGTAEKTQTLKPSPGIKSCGECLDDPKQRSMDVNSFYIYPVRFP